MPPPILIPSVEVLLPGGAYGDAIIADGASHYWQLNETTGTVASDRIGTAPGTISGGVTLGQAGALSDGSTAMAFDGSAGRILTTASVPLPLVCTIEGWIKVPAGATHRPLWATQNVAGATGDTVHVGTYDNYLFASTPTVALGGAVGAITAGTWHHVVYVLNGTTLTFYADGVAHETGAFARTTPSSGPASLGFTPALAALNGSLDEVAVYPLALTPTQIAAHYTIGLGTTSSLVWTDLTRDVIASAGIRATRGISGSGPMDRVAMPGVLTFTLRNDAGNSGHTLGWYSPDSTAVRPGWTAGIPVRLSLTYDETPYQIWTGRIRTIAPEPGRYLSRYVEVTAQDAIADLTETIVREIAPQINQTEDDLVAAVVAAIPASVQPPLALDPGLDTLPYVFDDIGDGASALQLLSDVMLSSFGTLFVAPDGTLTYRNRQVQSRETSSDTFTEDDLINDGGLVLQSGLGSVYNRVRATVHPRTVGLTTATVLFAVTGIVLVPPGETVTIWGSYADSDHLIRTIGGTDFQVPLTAGTDYAANSASVGGGTNLTASITVDVDAFASGVQFAVTNTGGTPAYLVDAAGLPRLQLRGRSIVDNAPLTVEAVTPQPYGDRLLNLDLKYQDDVEVARAMVDLLQSRYRDPTNRVVRIGINAQQSSRHLLAAVEREVGDVLTVSEPVTGINSANLMIRGVEWDIQLARPALVRTWWATAVNVSLSTDQWILDDAVFSVLDNTTILGVA